MLLWMWGKVREPSLPAAILITAFVPKRDSSGMDAIFLPSLENGSGCILGKAKVGTYKWCFCLIPYRFSPSDVAPSLTHLSPPSTSCKKNGTETGQWKYVFGISFLFSFNLLKPSLGRGGGGKGRKKPDGCSWSRTYYWGASRCSNLVTVTISL